MGECGDGGEEEVEMVMEMEMEIERSNSERRVLFLARPHLCQGHL